MRIQKELYEKYPKLFSAVGTREFVGCTIGPGWFPLVDVLCKLIQNEVDFANEQKKYGNSAGMEQVVVGQIKEKFGGLRFYTNKGGSTQIAGMIQMAEAMSWLICEECGTTKNVKTGGSGRIVTLCNRCRRRMAIRNWFSYMMWLVKSRLMAIFGKRK